MPDQVIFCPHCGTQQLKPDARFCHVCGRPIPAAPIGQSSLPSQGGGGGVGLWLLPLFLIAALALVFVFWEPARSRIAGSWRADGRPQSSRPAAN